MSMRLYKRSMDWRKKRDDKVRELRKKADADPYRPMRHGGASDGASAADHIDSYMEYNRLVGESDGGVLLGEVEYTELRRKAAEAAKNRLFVTWTSLPTGMDCYNIGPDSRCFCGHSYKAHAWYNTESKRVHCRCGGCRCAGFDYIPGHGSWWIKCECKHAHDEHRHEGLMGACKKARCGCDAFYAPFSCACGAVWEQHATVIQNARERRATGKPTENLGLAGAGGTAAAAGAITRFTSLLPGVDRAALEEAGVAEGRLPFTDGEGAWLVAAPAPEGDGAASGRGGGRGGGGAGAPASRSHEVAASVMGEAERAGVHLGPCVDDDGGGVAFVVPARRPAHGGAASAAGGAGTGAGVGDVGARLGAGAGAGAGGAGLSVHWGGGRGPADRSAGRGRSRAGAPPAPAGRRASDALSASRARVRGGGSGRGGGGGAVGRGGLGRGAGGSYAATAAARRASAGARESAAVVRRGTGLQDGR
mmetsp:Transcript_14551/g.39856  ORF Transcript_14551/g.39856 Transcript_14551/m.39856 type:complete len:477 (-) Transcript_14551:183-1613(-)